MSSDIRFISLALLGVLFAVLHYLQSDVKSVFLFVVNAAINIAVAALLYKIFIGKGGE